MAAVLVLGRLQHRMNSLVMVGVPTPHEDDSTGRHT